MMDMTFASAGEGWAGAGECHVHHGGKRGSSRGDTHQHLSAARPGPKLVCTKTGLRKQGSLLHELGQWRSSLCRARCAVVIVAVPMKPHCAIAQPPLSSHS